MLWQGFERISNAVLNWSPIAFKFTVGSTPLSTLAQVAGAIGLYYVVIFGGRELMRNRKPFGLNEVNKYHNLNLTLISGGLLALMLEQLVPSLLQNGLRFNMCGNAGFTPSLTTLYYLNYLTKYLEFADTVLLVLRKKPLTFLHTYHHGATAFLCYTQLIGHTPIAWVPIVLNLGVHVLMYWYYYRASCGVKSWYKEYITIMQIVQFVIDLGMSPFLPHLHNSTNTPPSCRLLRLVQSLRQQRLLRQGRPRASLLCPPQAMDRRLAPGRTPSL